MVDPETIFASSTGLGDAGSNLTGEPTRRSHAMPKPSLRTRALMLTDVFENEFVGTAAPDVTFPKFSYIDGWAPLGLPSRPKQAPVPRSRALVRSLRTHVPYLCSVSFERLSEEFSRKYSEWRIAPSDR
jgi:hypothetical protein